MPKRDAAYMEGQREAIAQAALDVLLEKGVYETSLRDICKAAGISVGALYTHFRTKEEAIVAACALDHAARKDAPPSPTWDEYVERITVEEFGPKGDRGSKRFRLSLQFVAEISQMDHNPDGLSAIYLLYRDHLARDLSCLHANGELALPLGLDMTTEIHMQLLAGAQYQLAADRDLPPQPVIDALLTALALTAGRASPKG